MTATDVSHVPLPAGAVRVHEWEPPEVTGYDQPERYFVGTERTAADFEVTIHGTQWADGRIDRTIIINEDPTSSADVRALAAVLVAAADEFDSLEAGR